MAKKHTPISLLKDTAALFKKRPELWGQAPDLVCHRRGSCYCVVTGIHHVQHGGTGEPIVEYGNPTPLGAEAIIHFAIANHLGRPSYRVREVTQWNDAPGRTVKEINDAFRKAIKTKFVKGAV